MATACDNCSTVAKGMGWLASGWIRVESYYKTSPRAFTWEFCSFKCAVEKMQGSKR